MKKTYKLSEKAFQLDGKMPLSQAIPLGLQHVLAMILYFKHGTKGFTSSSSILLGIMCGYAAAFVMGLVLPTTGVTADGVEYTKAWVLNWDKVPTRLDMGRLTVEFEHSYEPTGPFGAKSIGEIVINTPGPAIAHAIYRATGKWFRELPITPEQIAMALTEE